MWRYVKHGALAVAQVLCGVRWGHESVRLQRETHVRLTYLFLARVYRYGLPAPLTLLPEGSQGAAHSVSRRHDAVATCDDTVEHGALAVGAGCCVGRTYGLPTSSWRASTGTACLLL